MRNVSMKIAMGAIASFLLGGVAVAQNLEEVKVLANRGVMTTKPIGYTSIGVPIVDVSLSYSVSAGGLDLNASSGAAELEKRVNNAVWAACKEISRNYPDANPDNAECAKAAMDKAMVRVRELIASTHKVSGE